MEFSTIYSSFYVSDLVRAETFFSKLIGRAPDDRPIPGMVQWRFLGHAGLQLFLDAGKAGRSLTTIVTPDMAAAQASLAQEGLALGPVTRGPFGAIAQMHDPDGNRINIAEPPGKAAA